MFVAVKSQTTGSYWRVTTKYTLFNQPLPDSAIILEKDSAKFYQIVHIGGVLGTQNMAYAWSHGWVRRIPKDLLGYSIPGGGTVSLILQGYGIISTPNPLTTTGTIKVDSTVVASKLWVATYVGNRFALLGHTHSISDILHLGDSLKTYVPKTRTLTINGVSYTLNEDRTWTITFPKDSTYIKSGKGIRIDSIGNTYTVVNISEDSTYIKSGTGIRVDSVGNTYTITNIIPIPVDSTYIIAGNGIRIDSSGNTYTIVNISKDSTYIRAGTGISLVGSDSLHNTYTITNSSPSSGGTVTSISQGTGMLFSVNPLVTTGTIGIDTAKVMLFNDTLSAGKITTKKALIDGLALKRNLNNHDSLSTLDEKSYNSLSDKPTAWTIAQITNLSDSLKTYVPKGRTLSINGTSYNLNQNRTWTIALPKDSTYVKSGTWLTLAGSDSTHNSYTVSADTAKVVGFNDTLTAGKIATKKWVTDKGYVTHDTSLTRVYSGTGVLVTGSAPTYTLKSDTTINETRTLATSQLATKWSKGDTTATLETKTYNNSKLALKVPTSRTISTTSPLTGGGDLTTNRTFALDTTKAVLFNDTLTAGKIATKKWVTDKGYVTHDTSLTRVYSGTGVLVTGSAPTYTLKSDTTINETRTLATSQLATKWSKGDTTATLETKTYNNSKLALKVPTSRTISTTSPLTGGGDLTTNRTFALDTTKAVLFNDTLTAGKIATKKYVEDRKMVYPEAGIPISNGSAWSSSITDAHSNWDAGYTYRLTSATGTAPLTLTLGSNALTGSVAAFSTSTTSTGVVTGSNSLGPTYYLNGNNAWSIPPNTTYSAGYRIGLSSTTFNNLSYRKDIDTVKTTLTGFLKATAGVLSADNSTYLTTEVDGSTTNELQAISYANGKLTIGAGGGTPNTITLPKFSITDTARGLVPGSAAAAATNFLNASGAWSIPASATSYPGAGIPYSSGSAWSSSVDTIQYDTLQIQFVAPLSLSGSNVIVNTFSGSTAGVVPVSVGGTSNYLRADGAWATPGGGGSGMTWPGAAGITIYGGANAWGTSITDNHANWDNGYTYRVTSASGTAPLTLGLSSNALTGSMTQANTTTAGYLGSSDWNTFNGKRSLTNHDSLSTLDEKSYNSLTDRPTIPAAETTFGTVTSIATTAPITGGTITSSGTIGISAFAGSTPGAVPTSAGGTTNYLRADGNWAPPAGGSGMTWPSAGGIALCEGSSAWGTSITDNSSNWNKAYSWGPDLWTLNGSSIYRNSLVGVGISPLFNFHANMGSGRNIGFISDAGYAGTSGSAIVSVNNANNAYSPLSINASTLILQGSGGTGYVGIGTPPIRQLHSYSPTISNEFIMEVGDCAADHRKWNFIVTGGTGTNPNMYLRTLNDAGNATTQLAMEWQQDGKVGINTTTLTEMLTVNGNVSATKYLGSIEPLFGTAVDSTLVTTTIKFPIGYSQGFVVDTLIFIATTISTGTVNITPKLYYGIDVEAAGTAIITSPSAVTSHTAATKIYSFNNATVNKGNMVWLTFTNVTTKPRNFMLQIIGHRL